MPGKRKLTATTLSVIAASLGVVSATTISVNFTEGNANQQMLPATTAGIDVQANWNNTTGAAGTANSLVDSNGATTSASVTWTAAGVWGDASANTDADVPIGNAQLARGYMDDGGAGVDWTVSGIPYTQYTAILYLSTDTNGDSYRPFTVNGSPYSTTGTKSQYGGNPNWDATNSITVTGLSGDLVVDGLPRDGGLRGSVAGFQIVEVPEPGSMALFGLGGLALVLRRRK